MVTAATPHMHSPDMFQLAEATCQVFTRCSLLTLSLRLPALLLSQHHAILSRRSLLNQQPWPLTGRTRPTPAPWNIIHLVDHNDEWMLLNRLWLTGTLALIILHFASTLIVATLQCTPVTHYWQLTPSAGQPCLELTAFYLSTKAFTIFTDIPIPTLPIPHSCRFQQETRRQRVGVLVCFFFYRRWWGDSGDLCEALGRSSHMRVRIVGGFAGF